MRNFLLILCALSLPACTQARTVAELSPTERTALCDRTFEIIDRGDKSALVRWSCLAADEQCTPEGVERCVTAKLAAGYGEKIDRRDQTCALDDASFDAGSCRVTPAEWARCIEKETEVLEELGRTAECGAAPVALDERVRVACQPVRERCPALASGV